MSWTPLSWIEDDLGVDRWELVRAFMAAPILLAAFCVVILTLWLMAPA